MEAQAPQRLVVRHEVTQGQLSTAAAAELLGVTERHVRRLYRSAGGTYMVSREHHLSSGGVWRHHSSERL